MPEARDIVGQKFNHITVLENVEPRYTPNGTKRLRVKCLCDCGEIWIADKCDIVNGHTKACYKCRMASFRKNGIEHNHQKKRDRVGETYPNFTIIAAADDYEYGNGMHVPAWVCKCCCGNTFIAQGGNIANYGDTMSCGCKNKYSKGELQVIDVLEKYHIRYDREVWFEDLKADITGKNLRFDFKIYIDGKSALVEYQGLQHYETYNGFGAYQRFYSDKMKKEYCKENNIPLYEIKYDEDVEQKICEIVSALQDNTVPSSEKEKV